MMKASKNWKIRRLQTISQTKTEKQSNSSHRVTQNHRCEQCRHETTRNGGRMLNGGGHEVVRVTYYRECLQMLNVWKRLKNR